MPTASQITAIIFATGLLATTSAMAADPPPGSGPLCSPTVSAALTTWDAGLQAAGKFGDKAVAAARAAGRDYLLPLLGVDSKASPGIDDQTSAISRALESTRQDPQQRLDLCISITEAVEVAKGSANAGLAALKRTAERFATPPTPKTGPADGRELIKT